MKHITKSIRISGEQEVFLLESFKNVSVGIGECIDIVKSIEDTNFNACDIRESLMILSQIRKRSMGELKSMFTPAEWKFFTDSLNGSVIESIFRCNTSALAGHCQDAETCESLATKHGIDIPILIGKIKKMNGAQLDALYARVEDFWKKEYDLNAWAVY